ncbi:DUF2726 domain-containing protein [Nocardioides jejuensis]|nr:DUF2726 domain-containing protein [Nocardioides jejuensis]
MYVPADTDSGVPEQRILEAAARLPPLGAVTGWAACRLYGANFHDGLGRDGQTEVPVDLVVGSRGWTRPAAGVRHTYERLEPSEVGVAQGIRVVSPVRATFDAMRRQRSVREAVVELEKSVMADVVSIQAVAAHAATKKGAWRIQLVRDALPLARENAKSPQETRTRLVAHLDAGITGLLVNATLHTMSGALIGECDLVDPETGLVIEYDGADHEQQPRRHRDAIKFEALRHAGAEVLRVSPQLLREPERLAASMRDAQARARSTRPEQRRWQVVSKATDLDMRLRRERDLAAYFQAMDAAANTDQ